MKKKFCLAVIFIFMLSISSCGKKPQVNSQKSTPNVVAEDYITKKTLEEKKQDTTTPETSKDGTNQTKNNTKSQTTTVQKETVKPLPTPTAIKSPKVSDLMGKIFSAVKFYEMTDIDSGAIKDLYGIDTKDLEEYSVKMPLMNVKAAEIAIIKVKDEKKVQNIKNSIMNRQQSLEKSWEHYLPDQYDLVKNYVLDTKGKYIIFVIHQDAQKVKEVFMQELNKK